MDYEIPHWLERGTNIHAPSKACMASQRERWVPKRWIVRSMSVGEGNKGHVWLANKNAGSLRDGL